MTRFSSLALVGMGFFFLVMALTVSSILYLNTGHFVYTLDDPYIHLALAENIWRGHYGVNLSEFSAPSSSVIWPFLLAPVSQLEWAPLILNLLASCWAILIFKKAIDLSFSKAPVSFAWQAFFLIAFILISNLVGAALTGMEHSLQILCAVGAGYGLVKADKTGVVPAWLYFIVILGPLVRYENIAISAAVLGYLMLSRAYVNAIATGFVMLIPLLAFSAFLVSIGMDAMPSSINAKSDLVSGQGRLVALTSNVVFKLLHPHGLFLVVCLAVLYRKVLKEKTFKNAFVLHALALAVAMHFVAGKFGWLNRYELYILAFSLPVLLYLFSESVIDRLSPSTREKYTWQKLKFGLVLLFLSGLYVVGLPILPISSNNIHEQQYQMHRLATEFYKKPIAVNDLGYISYKNDEYILDLWGLASFEALTLRQQSETAEWIQPLIGKKQVGLAIIYDKWFEQRPKQWIRVATMEISRPGIIVGDTKVAMYATSPASLAEVNASLDQFETALPQSVILTRHN